jgi:hypothetical protein
MRRPGVYPILWGLLLGASAGMLWGFSFGLPHGSSTCSTATCVAVPALAPGLLTAAAAASIVLGIVLTVGGVSGIDRGRRPVADQSMASVALAVSIALAALGGAVGNWLLWIGLGLIAGSAAGVIREQLALRELRRKDPGP